MARRLVGIENDGYRTQLVYEQDGVLKYEDTPLGFKRIDSLAEQVSK